MTTSALATHSCASVGDRARLVALLAAGLSEGTITPAQIAALPEEEAFRLVAPRD